MTKNDRWDLTVGSVCPMGLFRTAGLVMFPHVMQPLRIDELGHVQLLEDALADNRQLATVWLESSSKPGRDEGSRVGPMACICRIVSCTRSTGGGYHVLSVGLGRAQVRRHLVSESGYQRAEVEVVADEYSAQAAEERASLRRQLTSAFRAYLPQSEVVQAQFEYLLSSRLPLGILADIVAFTINLRPDRKQQVLEQLDADRRAGQLLQMLRHFDEDGVSLPIGTLPGFSAN